MVTIYESWKPIWWHFVTFCDVVSRVRWFWSVYIVLCFCNDFFVHAQSWRGESLKLCFFKVYCSKLQSDEMQMNLKSTQSNQNQIKVYQSEITSTSNHQHMEFKQSQIASRGFQWKRNRIKIASNLHRYICIYSMMSSFMRKADAENRCFL